MSRSLVRGKASWSPCCSSGASWGRHGCSSSTLSAFRRSHRHAISAAFCLMSACSWSPGTVHDYNILCTSPWIDGAQVSWCKLEVTLESPKAVLVSGSNDRAPPPLTVAAINLKTHVNGSSNSSAIVAASVVHLSRVRVDGPTPKVLREAMCTYPKHKWPTSQRVCCRSVSAIATSANVH